MDDRRVADYFVVCGLSPNQDEWEEDTSEDSHYKVNHNQAPITDLAVIFPTLGECVPDGFDVIKSTPTGLLADLNHGSFKSPEVFLCYRRGRDKPPLVDVGIMYDNKEKILPDSEIVSETPEGRCANVNNSTPKTFVTFRRAPPTLPPNTLVVTDVCVIITSKLETPPHAFCVIKKNLNRGLVGSDVFLCYKKSMNTANSLIYKPQILAKYPDRDYEGFNFPSCVPIFCLPMGATLEAWPTNCQQPVPIFSTFVLTVSDAVEKVYGSAVTFYESYPSDKVTQEQKHKLRVQCDESSPDSCCPRKGGPPAVKYHTNKCICLLSHWPFFSTFEKYLLFLYNMSVTGPHSVPIERMVTHLLEDIPFPSVQRPRILVQLSQNERLILTQPEDLPLPRSGASFRQLLLNLGPDNTLLLLLCALTEQKLLIHSLRPDVLTSVAEAVSMIIFPFKWQCPYIPLCPLSLAEVLHAPLPFLIGVDSRFFDLYDPPPDVNCVDLDTNNITMCEDKRNITGKLLPKKPSRTLRATLHHVYYNLLKMMHTVDLKSDKSDLPSSEQDGGEPRKKSRANSIADLQGRQNTIENDFKIKRQEQLLELKIQEAFLRFMASILKGYREFLLPIIKAPTVGATDTSSLFDLEGFLRSRDRANVKFFAMIVRTQMFIRFIEERSFVSDMDTGLAFFDECIEKVENEEKYLDLDDSQKSERTVFIMPPEPVPGSHTMYSYEDGFTMDPVLFHYNKEHQTNFLDMETKTGAAAPGSPMAQRTKQEIKRAQSMAKKSAKVPVLWARCLFSTCHSIWFFHLPSYMSMSDSKASVLRSAYELLAKAQKHGLEPTDEVCYRVMMQLCLVYSQPIIAVKLLFLMRQSGIEPNAITYGFYNRAVLETKWSSDMYNSAKLMWNKLRNVIRAAALLRQAGIEASKRRLNVTDAEKSNSTTDVCQDSTDAVGTQVPLDLSKKPSVPNLVGFQAFDKFRSRVGSIVRPSGLPLFSPGAVQRQQSFESSAGLLMTGGRMSEDPEKILSSDRLDSLLDALPPVHTRMPPKRKRSDSCTEITFANHQVTSNTNSSNNSNGPATNSSSHHGPHHKRHHHHHHHQPSKPNDGINQGYSKLLRSKSFAHDAQILEKLRDMKLEMSSISSGIETARTVNQSGSNPRRNSRSKKGSLGRVRELPKGESLESSNENLGSSTMGSTDDLESSSVVSTPKRLANSSRILSSLSAKMDRLRSVDGWSLNRRNSVESSTGDDQIRRIASSNDSLNYSTTTSPLKLVNRTLVTENDPLGALELLNESTPTATNHLKDEDMLTLRIDPNHSSILRVSSEIELDQSGAPVLFDRRKEYGSVTRSATFHEEEDEHHHGHGSPMKRNMQRSSTMPFNNKPLDISPSGSKSSSSASNNTQTSSAFKLPFSSPAKFNISSVDLKLNKEYLENALYSLSPSGLTSKKSNELLIGGFNSLKTAATSITRKFDEIKEAISTSGTPVKGSSGGDRDSGCGDDDASSVAGLETPRRKISSEFTSMTVSIPIDQWGTNLRDLLTEGMSRKGSTSNLQPSGENNLFSSHQCLINLEKYYTKTSRDVSIPVALELVLTTCSRCHQCSAILYDEEIMSGWKPEDSNLTTKCQFCDKATVPLLNVTIVDYRSSHPASSATDSQDSIQSRGKFSHPLADSTASMSTLSSEDSSEPIVVPYLNPLVLRKELESILNTEGDECLQRSEFVDDHPVIYWNMIWFFERISVQSHMPGLALNSKCVLSQRNSATFDPSWLHCDQSHVFVRTMWDNHRLYDDVGQPLYVLWNQNEKQSSLVSALITDRTYVPKSVMHDVISFVRCNNLREPLRKLSIERHKMKLSGVNRSLSLYREILFLSFTVIGREFIDQATFDREYATAYESVALPINDSKMFLKCDTPIDSQSLFCRHFFKELEL